MSTLKPYYDEDGITIYHGDCRQATLPPVDVVVTDPPYGVGLDYGSRTDDTEDELADVINWLEGFADGRMLITPGIVNLWRYPVPLWVLAWHKPGSTRRSLLGGFNEWEPVLVYGRPPQRVYHDAIRLPTISNISNASVGSHPAPKPLKLLSWLVEEFTTPADTILDPFMGSGTTLVAAKSLGRKAIGIEIEERYCEIAVQRLAQGVLEFE